MNEIARRWRVLAGGAGRRCGRRRRLRRHHRLGRAAAPATAAARACHVTQTVTVPPAGRADRRPVQPGTPAPPPRRHLRLAGIATPAAARAAAADHRARRLGHACRLLQGEGRQAWSRRTAADFKALNIVLPMPTGWTQVPDPNVPDAFAVIADRVGGDGLYTSNARSWSTSWSATSTRRRPSATASSTASSCRPGGPPTARWPTSAACRRRSSRAPTAQNNMTLNTSRRHVIATAGPDKYLVSLAVTTSVEQVGRRGRRHRRHRQRLPGEPRPAAAARTAAPAPGLPAVT